MTRWRWLLALLCLAALALPAQAQTYCRDANGVHVPITSGNCDSLGTTSSGSSGGGGGGGTAAIAPGFVPNLNFATLTATGSSASVALPAGFAVLFQNTGTTTVSCTLGVGSATATANELLIPANSPAIYIVGINTFGACIDQTGTASNLVVLAGGAIQDSVVPGVSTSTLTGWTTATAGNTTQTLFSTGGWPSVILQLDQTSTISAGAITIEGTYDSTNWVTIPVAQVLNPNTLAPLTNPYTLVASTNQPFLILTQGYQAVRIRLSTTITGTATVTPFVTLLPYNPTISALLNPLAPGTAVIGKVGIDQTTPGTTNGVILTSQYPFGATAITASATGTTAATTATLAGTSGKTTYICGYSIRANATAATTVTDTITGVITGTLSSVLWVAPLASGLGVDEQIFSPCIPASATNTGIAIVSGAPGSGGTVSSRGWGYQL